MRGSPVRFDDMGGGVNLKDAPYLIDTKEARDLRNVVSRAQGSVRARDGALAVGAAQPASVTGVFAADVSSAVERLLVTRSGVGLAALNAGGAVMTTYALAGVGRMEWSSAPSITGGSPATTQGPFFGVDGTNAIFWDGAAFGAWTAITGVLPIGKYLTSWDNRMIVAGVASARSRLFGSDIGNARDWDTADGGSWAVDLDPGDGFDLTAVGQVGPHVLAFKKNKAWVVYDSATGANRRLGENVGCVAHRSIVETPFGTMFLGEDAVYVTDGERVTRISDKIEPLLEDIPPARRAEAAGEWFNGRYYLSVCLAGSVNDTTLEYDPVRKSWWVHTLASPQWVTWRPSSSLGLFGASGAQVLQGFVPGVATDLGVAYTSYWKSGWHAFQKPFLRKRCRQVHVDGSGAFDVYVGKDFANSDTLLGTLDFAQVASLFGGAGTFGGEGIFGDGAPVGERSHFSLGVGRAWSTVFTSQRAFEVFSYTMSMTERTN